jgi:hypothetical protein
MKLLRTVLAITVALLAGALLLGAAPPGVQDRVSTRKLVSNVRVARGTCYRTPWVYVGGSRQAIWQLDCAPTAPMDSAYLSVHLADDTTKAVLDSVAASSSVYTALDSLANVALIGMKGGKRYTRNAAKTYVLVPLAPAGGGASLTPYIPIRWARLSIMFAAAGPTVYNGCDSLCVRSTTLRDWIFGTFDY